MKKKSFTEKFRVLHAWQKAGVIIGTMALVGGGAGAVVYTTINGSNVGGRRGDVVFNRIGYYIKNMFE